MVAACPLMAVRKAWWRRERVCLDPEDKYGKDVHTDLQ